MMYMVSEGGSIVTVTKTGEKGENSVVVVPSGGVFIVAPSDLFSTAAAAHKEAMKRKSNK